MHKEHAVEMIESIIKETDLDPCTVKTTEDLEVLGLFNLSRVLFFKYFFILLCSILLFMHLLMIVLISGVGAHEGASG